MNPNSSVWRGRRVLLTGHTGFKGAWLSLWLSRLGAKVCGLSLAPSTEPSLFNLAVRGEGLDSHLGDIRDLNAVRACMEAARPDVVFHLAAQALVRPSYVDPVGTYATNVMGTVHVLEAIREIGTVKAAVIVTSDKCYENREWHWAYRENEAMGGHDPYSNSKGCSELVTSAYRQSFFGSATGCRIASARAGNVFGGGDWSSDRLIPDIVRAILQDKSVEIRNPNAIRPWQHVLEPLNGYIRLAESLLSPEGDTYAEGWNFGPTDEDCQPVSHIVERVTRDWGSTARWHASVADHPHEANFLKVDASKAKARLGWRRKLRLDPALKMTVDWYSKLNDGADARRLTLEQIEQYEQLQDVS